MKYINNNLLSEPIYFDEYNDYKKFIDFDIQGNILILEDSLGEKFCVIKFVDSLDDHLKLILGFNYDNKDNIRFVFLPNTDKIVLILSEKIYIISIVDKSVRAKVTTFLPIPIIGIHVMQKRKRFLILEEIGYKIIDFDGQIVKEESFDLISDFSLKNDELKITLYNGENKKIML